MKRRSVGPLVAIVALAAACNDQPAPSPSPSAAALADRPGVTIDGTWTAVGGRWTFTGSVDPQGDPTDVILEIGPGPATLRQFDSQVPVAQGLATAQALTITTSAIPDIPEICVRFTATNHAGGSFSPPLCFPHDLPTIGPADAPLVRVDQVAPGANAQWTVSAYVDPRNATTDVTLDVGTGPASHPTFSAHVTMATAISEAATLQVSTQIPNTAEVCLRVTATNSVGTTSSAPSCFSPAGPS